MFPSYGTPLLLSGPDFRYTNFPGGRGFRILPTHTFRVAGVLHFTYTHFSGGRGFAFDLHTFSGRFLRQFEKIDVNFEKISALRAAFFLRNP